MQSTYLYATILITISCVDSAKILAVFPLPCISHQVVFRPLTQELAKRGHEVTVLTTDSAFSKDEAPKNLKEIDLHESHALWEQVFLNLPTVIDSGAFDRVRITYECLLKLFEAQMNNEEVQNILKDVNFDLLIMEASMRPILSLAYRYQVPTILFSSFGAAYYGLMESLTGPFHPIIHLGVNQRRLYNLTTSEIIEALTYQYKVHDIIKEFEDLELELSKRMFGPAVPPTSVIINNVDLLFLNVHPLWENIKPVPSSLVYLGGLPQKLDKELPKDLKSYLDSSKNGVIYVSFGTNVAVSQIPVEKRDIFLKVFSKLPYDILWKCDSEELSQSPSNLKLGKWFPQSDLLKHPNVKLFITQGGLQSTDEAIAAGVPMIGIPMHGDQWFNAEQYGKFGIGVGLKLETLTEEKLLEAIEKVIGDESYRRNIARHHYLVNDQPQSSLDRAVWWTEYLLRHGGKHLRTPAANMPLAEYLELELIFILLLLVSVVIFLVKITVQCVIKLLRH